MRSRRTPLAFALFVALAAAASTLATPAALSTALPAQPTILAAPGAWLTQYATPEMATTTGVGLAFRNEDIMKHDVLSVANGPDGAPWCVDVPPGHCPLFHTALLNRGQTARVEGIENAPPGTYDFYCSLHTAMRGTLVIAS